MGRPDVGKQEQATGVDKELAFTALGFLVPIEAFGRYAPLAEFDGLGLEHGHARARLAGRRGPLPVAAYQRLVELGPAPVGFPAAEIRVGQRKSGKIVGQQPLLAAALGQGESRKDSRLRVCSFFNNLPPKSINSPTSINLCVNTPAPIMKQ